MKKITPKKMALVVLAVFSVLMFSATQAVFALNVLDPTTIPKFVDPLPIPKAMPMKGTVEGGKIDYYEIAARQIKQQILPAGYPMTTIWSYGAANNPSTFSYPSPTIEAKADRAVRVKWINDLKDSNGKFIPHIVPVDQTLFWTNPPQQCIDGTQDTDCRGFNPFYYKGPVPIVTHLHGAHVTPESDGFPTAWYLPNANNIPAGYAKYGANFQQIPGVPFQQGAAVYQYKNDQRATTLWYHDHSVGMTRANLYAGLAGFYLIRGGSSDLSGDAPNTKLPSGKYEIPLAIQDKSFNSDGSLFYAPNRAFFEGLAPEDLKIPFIPSPVVYKNKRFPQSDVSPTWNPEFFGNTIVVNGKTWPYLKVEKKRYRFRILNADDTRVLILTIPTDAAGNTLPIWVIGNDGGFLPERVKLNQLLLGGAERADVIIDFSDLAAGTKITLQNIGPDEPFGGGVPGTDFPVADPATTGLVMQFRVIDPEDPVEGDTTTLPGLLKLPAIAPFGPVTNTRQVTLNEFDSSVVLVRLNAQGQIVLAPTWKTPGPNDFLFGPTVGKLGVLDNTGKSIALDFPNRITENPAIDSTEVWEIYNFTADAHPIHIHQVAFEVINRQALATDVDGLATQPALLVGGTIPPDPYETGLKDTVLVYPGGVTRVKMHFDIPGLYVWHCHILSMRITR